MIGERRIVTVAERLWPGTVTDLAAGQVRVIADCGSHRWYPTAEVWPFALVQASLVASIAADDAVIVTLKAAGDRPGARASEQRALRSTFELITLRRAFR
jgi:hypothetical protein